MFGSHLSISGSLAGALREAESLGMETVQVFTRNQRQWAARPLDEGVIADWKAESGRLGWQARTVSHASYLINLASPSGELWEKSIALMRDEIDRCEALGIPFLVHHPGSAVGSTADAGLARIAEAYARLFRDTPGYRTVCCLENTVGAGAHLGRGFDELARLREMIADATGRPDRVGFCLDTCHLHAGGYDMSSVASAGAVLADFDRVCGLTNLKAMHVNDSKGALGSRLDRHEHIGDGEVGRGGLAASGFAAVVRHPVLARLPKILETPKGQTPDGTSFDTVNLARLRALLPGAQPYAGPSLVAATSSKRAEKPAPGAGARRGGRAKTGATPRREPGSGVAPKSGRVRGAKPEAPAKAKPKSRAGSGVKTGPKVRTKSVASGKGRRAGSTRRQGPG